jgi:hypothetical protein
MGVCVDPKSIRDELHQQRDKLDNLIYGIDKDMCLTTIDIAKEKLKEVIFELISQHGYLEGCYEAMRSEEHGHKPIDVRFGENEPF